MAEADRGARARTGLALDLSGKIEEQGLQAAAMARMQPLYLVRLAEVNLCSPFGRRRRRLGVVGRTLWG